MPNGAFLTGVGWYVTVDQRKYLNGGCNENDRADWIFRSNDAVACYRGKKYAEWSCKSGYSSISNPVSRNGAG